MFENMNLGDMGKMLEKVQEQAKNIEHDNEQKIFTTKSGGGLVEVSINGKGEVIDVTIDDSLLEDKESLQILLISAVNDASKMVEDNRKQGALNMLGGINPFGNNS